MQKFWLKVVSGSKKTTILPSKKTDYKYIAHLKEKPQKNRANLALIKLLADYFKINKNQIFIKIGQTAKKKLIEIY